MRSDVTMTSYVIYVGKDPAGILVTSTPTEQVNAHGCGSYMEDLYIMPKYRKRGIGTDIFLRFVRQQKWPVNFCVMKKNTAALHIWEKIIQQNQLVSERAEYDEGKWIYKVSISTLK